MLVKADACSFDFTSYFKKYLSSHPNQYLNLFSRVLPYSYQHRQFQPLMNHAPLVNIADKSQQQKNSTTVHCASNLTILYFSNIVRLFLSTTQQLTIIVSSQNKALKHTW